MYYFFSRKHNFFKLIIDNERYFHINIMRKASGAGCLTLSLKEIINR